MPRISGIVGALTPKISRAGKRVFKAAASPALIDRFRRNADRRVKSSIGKEMPPAMAAVFALNSMTGVGLLTVPQGFAHAGLLLGSITLVLSMALTYITSTFMCEALSIANALHFEEAVKDTMKDEGLRKRLHQEHEAAREQLEAAKKVASMPSFKLQYVMSPLLGRRDTEEDFHREFRATNPHLEFKIRERVELGTMGEMVLQGKCGSTMMYFAILCYTYGAMCGLLITASKSLAHFAQELLHALGHEVEEDATYRWCVAAVFCITLPLCLTDLQKTKNFTLVVMVLRAMAISLMIAAASVRVGSLGSSLQIQQIPLWNFEYFTTVYGNCVFMFAIHHNLPSVVAPVRPAEKAPTALGRAFLGCGLVALAVASSALLAWDGESCAEQPGDDFCEVRPLYNLNFKRLPWGGGAVGAFICFYPALSVAGVPPTAISTRNTLSYILGLRPPDPTAPINLKGTLLLLAVLLPPFAVAALTQDIQAVTKVVGGYAGLTIAVLLPLILVVRGRAQLRLDVGRGVSLARPLKSPFANAFGYGFVGVAYLASLAVVTQEMFF